MPREIGDVIASLREQRGWSMGQLALYSGLTTGAISQIENGITKNPLGETIGKLANALGISPNYLYEQAGWYESRENPTLPPEVLELAEVVDAYPEGPAREQATQMIIDIALILQTLRERMEDAASVEAAEKDTEP